MVLPPADDSDEAYAFAARAGARCLPLRRRGVGPGGAAGAAGLTRPGSGRGGTLAQPGWAGYQGGVLLVVVPLAVLAAFLYALSDFLEQRAAHRSAAQDAPAVPGSGLMLRRLFSRLVRDRVWVLGWGVGTVAYLVQAAGLHLGSVTVVQSLQVTTLLFALPLSTIRRPERVGPREWAGGAAITLGLLGFLLSRGAPPGAEQADRGRLIPIVLVLALTVVVLVLLARAWGGALRAVLLAVAAGVAFASSATLVKLTAQDLTTVGAGGTARDWVGYALAAATATGLVLQQVAFASGKLPTATTAMVVANPFVGTILAVLAFHEALPQDPARLAALALSAAVVVAGVAALAHSPLLGADTEEDRAAEAAEAAALPPLLGRRAAHRPGG